MKCKSSLIARSKQNDLQNRVKCYQFTKNVYLNLQPFINNSLFVVEAIQKYSDGYIKFSKIIAQKKIKNSLIVT